MEKVSNIKELAQGLESMNLEDLSKFRKALMHQSIVKLGETIDLAAIITEGFKAYKDDILHGDEIFTFWDKDQIHDFVKEGYPEIYKQILLDTIV